MRMNFSFLIGRLTKGIEVRSSTTGNPMVKFTLAVWRSKDHTDFINCQAFGKNAEKLDGVEKGTEIAVQGNIKTGSYEKDGRKVYTTDIFCDQVEVRRDPLEGIL